MRKIRGDWGQTRFKLLYEKKPRTPLCDYFSKGSSDNSLIIVHHLHEASYPFIKALAKKYEIQKIIGIPYSSMNFVVEKLKDDFDVVVPKLENMALEVKKAIESSPKKVLIEEIGAYTSSISEYLEKNQKVLGITEDTHQGHWRWSEKNLSRLPIMSVAYSRQKRYEDRFVSMSIIDGIDNCFSKYKLGKLDNKKIQILGYGNLGTHLTELVEKITENVSVYDVDPLKNLNANLKHKVVRDLDSDVIIGVTGNPKGSISGEDLSKIRDECILVSGSSKRVEFNLESIKKASDSFEKKGNIFHIKFENKDIRILNLGEPINLRYSQLPSKVLDLVYGSLVYSLNQLDLGRVKPGLHNLSKEEEEKIVQVYQKIYGI